MCKVAQQEWLSLFTSEVECLWNTEPTEIRMIIILHNILQKEFKRIETNISEKIETFKHKMKLASSLEESGYTDSFQLSLTNTNIDSLESLERSPKIKRYRKVNRKKDNSPSLLNSSRDSLNCSSFSLLNPVKKLCDKSVSDDCVMVSNAVKEDVISCESNANDVVDTSILNDSVNISTHNRKIKISKSKKMNKSNKNNSTLTQLINSKSWSNNVCKIDVTNTKTIKDESKTITLINPIKKSNIFQNYDRIPVKKSVVPEHPHKMETVRCKADKLRLPGWSCKECQDYYQDFDLTDEELRKKMNVCSKHRNKFDPLNETPKGYWDVTMYSSQED